MYYSLNTTESNHNIVNYLHNRENHWSSAKVLQQNFQFTRPLLKRLTLEHQLDGHSGCINCLEWTSNGKLLASGSDDIHVRIWDPFNYKCLNVISTTHVGNIFSIKFLGDESLIATGAGDCRVLVRSIDDTRTSAPHITCKCHRGRVKRLAKAPDQPLLFWSASEDGLVIQYDLREPHECMVKSTIFIELADVDLKCISINPTKPHLVAVGANDCYVRLYDRRMVRTSQFRTPNTLNSPKRELPEPQDSNCVQYYSPGHLAKDCKDEDLSDKLAATYVTFNRSGTELLVNMGGEHIYLYDLNNSQHIDELSVPENLFNYRNGDCLNYEIETNINVDIQDTSDRSAATVEYVKKAERLLRRNWSGDTYSAARYYYNAMQQRPTDKKILMAFIKCLIDLKWYYEARNWLNLYQKRFPYDDCKELASNVHTCCKCNEERHVDPSMTKQEKDLRAASKDYELRFVGHCNTTTDIKEVNYLGENGNYICAGSDDGLIFIWDRQTTEVLTALRGDASIVNCIQPHPSACYLASSGIDPCIRLWSPAKEDGTLNPYIITDPDAAIEANQRRMTMNPFETMLIDMGYRRVRDFNSPQRIHVCRAS
ncbi:wd repeat domain-containing family [Holotrichia oblita]|uniref:Wd repeat domain-containing family n=1 Tax=Holotrichia oblita TaxID=644536 RepID=A0ACB9SVR6_HOLOL|nr:wd repeat domain-containing family [Holotrichia oblita]